VTRLYLVRHGETLWHAENRYAGSSDVGLTERGKAQAERLGAWAAGAGLGGLWVSPLSRARDTATPAAKAAGLEPVVDERLRELHFGEAEGLTRTEMAGLWPGPLAAFEADPVEGHLPGGEHPAEAADRATAALLDAAATGSDRPLLVVFHSSVLRLALCRLLGLPLGAYRTTFPGVANISLTEVELRPDLPPALLTFNAPLPAAHERAAR
jgi:probable phosphoglycerate mutase